MQFKYKLLPFFVTAAMAVAGGTAIAAPLQGQEASAIWSFDGNPLPAAPQSVDSAAGFPGSVDVLPSDFSGGSEIFAHSYGSVGEPGVGTVSFGSRASGTGQYDITSQYNLRGYEFLVPGASGLVDVFFSFVIDNGELAIYCSDCDQGSASLTIDINVGTSLTGPRTDVGDGQASLEILDNDWSLTHSGIASSLGDLATTPSGSTGTGATQFSWNATPFNILLGSYAAGTTLYLDYDLITTASGRFSQTDAYGYAGGSFCNDVQEFAPTAVLIDEVPIEEPGVCYFYSGNTISRAGDPFPGAPATSVGFNVPNNNVPEPGSLALVGAGLAAAFAARRRKGAKKA